MLSRDVIDIRVNIYKKDNDWIYGGAMYCFSQNYLFLSYFSFVLRIKYFFISVIIYCIKNNDS
jgi:hypothetical protein